MTTDLVGNLDALIIKLFENAEVGSLNYQRAELIRNAANRLDIVENKLAERPVVPDNIEQAYIDGYEAATRQSSTVVMLVAPEVNDMIELGVKAVTGALEATLAKLKEDR